MQERTRFDAIDLAKRSGTHQNLVSDIYQLPHHLSRPLYCHIILASIKSLVCGKKIRKRVVSEIPGCSRMLEVNDQTPADERKRKRKAETGSVAQLVDTSRVTNSRAI